MYLKVMKILVWDKEFLFWEGIHWNVHIFSLSKKRKDKDINMNVFNDALLIIINF